MTSRPRPAACGHLAQAVGLGSRIGSSAASSRSSATRSSDAARGADLVERAAAVAGRDVDAAVASVKTVVSKPSRIASSAVARTQ